jgi:hypothetical protein
MLNMKRIILASLLLSAPALAQQPPTPGQRATEIMLQREIAAHQQDLGAAVQLQDQVTALTKQVADLTKERDALKAPATPAQSDPQK